MNLYRRFALHVGREGLLNPSTPVLTTGTAVYDAPRARVCDPSLHVSSVGAVDTSLPGPSVKSCLPSLVHSVCRVVEGLASV